MSPSLELAQAVGRQGGGGGKNTRSGNDRQDDQIQYPVSASDAAEIARQSVPGSTVLKVRLLPSGVYAVTLKDGDNVSKVMVDATTGNIS